MSNKKTSNETLDIQLDYISNLKPNQNHRFFFFLDKSEPYYLYVPVNADVNQNASWTETCAFTFPSFTNRGSKESIWFQEATHLGKALVMSNHITIFASYSIILVMRLQSMIPQVLANQNKYDKDPSVSENKQGLRIIPVIKELSTVH